MCQITLLTLKSSVSKKFWKIAHKNLSQATTLSRRIVCLKLEGDWLAFTKSKTLKLGNASSY